LDEEEIKRRKFRAAENFLNVIQWTVKALLIPLGGITLSAVKLTYICLRDNLQEILPYSIIVTMSGFAGIIIAIYLGFNVKFEDLLVARTSVNEIENSMIKHELEPDLEFIDNYLQVLREQKGVVYGKDLLLKRMDYELSLLNNVTQLKLMDTMERSIKSQDNFSKTANTLAIVAIIITFVLGFIAIIKP